MLEGFLHAYQVALCTQFNVLIKHHGRHIRETQASALVAHVHIYTYANYMCHVLFRLIRIILGLIRCYFWNATNLVDKYVLIFHLTPVKIELEVFIST